jgi:hypothetical protein
MDAGAQRPMMTERGMLAAGLLIVAAFLGCGGGAPDAPAAAAVEISRFDFIVRPDAAGQWYVQGSAGHPDPDHMPIGSTGVIERPDALELTFGRVFTHAVVIQVTSDDDFGKAGIAAHCSLGLASSRCIITHRFEQITPAKVLDIVPRGSGTFGVSVVMADRADRADRQ